MTTDELLDEARRELDRLQPNDAGFLARRSQLLDYLDFLQTRIWYGEAQRVRALEGLR